MILNSLRTAFPPSISETPTKSVHTFVKLSLPAPLWTPGSVFPEPGTHIVHLPFRLALPSDLAPSLADGGRTEGFHSSSLSAKIEYSLVVRGARRGLFRRDRWVEEIVDIVMAAKPEDAQAKAILVGGPWTGEWRTLSTQTTLPGGTLARADLTIPDIASYPSDTQVPYRLRILTQSVVTHSASSTTPPSAPELPDVPSHPSELKLGLARHLSVRADAQESRSTSLKSLGGLGISRSAVRSSISAPTFVLDSAPAADGSKTKGVWHRASRFEGTLLLAGSPSFSSKEVSVSYTLRLHAPIPGTTAVLSADWDVALSSGIEASPPAFDFDSVSEIQTLRDGLTTPCLDLPPSA
jgi:hypothetical protein